MNGYLDKNKLNNLSFYKSLAPFYYTLKIFGLAPYDFDFKTGNIKTTLINYVIVFLNLIIHVTAFLLSSYEAFNLTNLTIAQSGWNFQQVFQTFIAIFVVVHNYKKRKHVFNYIKLLNNVDKIVNDLKWRYKVNHFRNGCKTAFWLAFHGVLIILFYFLILFGTIKNSLHTLFTILRNLILFFAIQTYTMIIYEFIFSVCCINSQFDCLNKNAEFLLNSFKLDFFWSLNQVNTKVKCIKKLAFLHDSLNDAIDCINCIYSIEVNSELKFQILIIK